MDKDTKAWSILPRALVHPWLGKDRALFPFLFVLFLFFNISLCCAHL